MPQQFTNRELVVIGGSSGIGRRVPADVVAAGGSVVIVGHRQDKVEQTVAELSATGTAGGIAADLPPLVGVLDGKGRPAHHDPAPGHRAGRAPHPGQRCLPGGGVHPDPRGVHPARRGRSGPCRVQRLLADRADRYHHRRSGRHHVPALRAGQLGTGGVWDVDGGVTAGRDQ